MSSQKCCVPGCGNTSGSDWPLHRFPNPVKDKEMFNAWVYAVGGPILALANDHIFKYRRVCRVHFEEKFWCQNKRLSNVAVPTKKLPGLSVEKFVEERRILRPIQNICTEASSSKATVTSQMNAQTEIQNLEMRENLEPVITSKCSSTSLLLAPQNVVKDIEMIDREPVSSQKKSAAVLRKTLRKRVSVTSAEHALYQKLVRVGIQLRKCRNKSKSQAKKIRAMKNIATNPSFLKTLDNLTSTAKLLTLMQLRECKKRNKGQRFTLKEKLVALSIQKQSPKGYRFLRKIFTLPSPQTLTKLINMANIKPGINENTVHQIKKLAEKMKIQDRLCVVLFDEMSLKPNIFYNERKDRVTGFVTDGTTTHLEFADHAQVFMVRGLIKNYKQPVAYTFSQSATKGSELAIQLKAVIKALQDAGLIVVATVCDQGTNNSQCYKILTQEARGLFLRTGQEPRYNIMLFNNQEIIPLYDPPHLMKCIRNNMITKDLKYQKDEKIKTAKWLHISALHEENPGYKGIRLVPKLTDQHCIPTKIPRMKVKYATQLFSQTVASNMGYLADKGILPLESKETADVLLFFDKLFDSVNGSYTKAKKHGKPLLAAATPKSSHHQFWPEAKKMLKTMNFVNNKTNKIEHVPSVKNWIWTLDGIEALLKKIQEQYNVTSVWLRHLNQDPLENFFGSIRSHGCRNINPTPDNFESSYTTLLVNCLSSAHAPGANCEIDDCVALHEAIITGASEKCQDSEINIPDIMITGLENKSEPHKIGGLQYVSGYFIKKGKKRIFKGCHQCKNDLISENELEYLKYREYANKKWLYSPSDSLLSCISDLQDISYGMIKVNIEKNNLKELIKTIIFLHEDFNFIKCMIHKELLINFIINVSCRFFIHSYCKDLNKILRNKRDCDDDADVLKAKAKKYSMKCFKRNCN